MQALSERVLRDKYLLKDETDAGSVFNRIAAALSSCPSEATRFRWAMNRGLLPAGHIAAGAGGQPHSTLINCFVQPVPNPTTPNPRDCTVFQRCLTEAATTLEWGGGVGYDFSKIHPRNPGPPNSTPATWGPVDCLDMFEAMSARLPQHGSRRGAQMGVLRCDHPDIESFIHAKKQPGALSHFNLSVGITDTLMRAVGRDEPFPLVHSLAPTKATTGQRLATGQWLYRTIRARDLWSQITGAAHGIGEPGVLYLDTINAENNLSYCETISATNPCGELPLPSYACCALASIDLTRIVQAPFTTHASIDWHTLSLLAEIGVEILESVLDKTGCPLLQHANEALSKRRIGLGFLGLADALIMLGIRYDSLKGRGTAANIAREIRDNAYRTSVRLARLKGPFRLFDPAGYLAKSHFASRLPPSLRVNISRYGLRHSHLLAVAPTGSIALAFADNASPGIEPAYDFIYQRTHRRIDGELDTYQVEERAFRLWQTQSGTRDRHHSRSSPYPTQLPPAFVSAQSIREDEQLAVVSAVAPFIDSAIANTVCLSPGSTPETVSRLLQRAWIDRVKGVTVYRAGAHRDAPLHQLRTPSRPPADPSNIT